MKRRSELDRINTVKSTNETYKILRVIVREKPCRQSSASDFSPRGRIGDHSKVQTHQSRCGELKFIKSVQTFHRKVVKGSVKVSWVESNEMPTRRKRTTVYESSKLTSTPLRCFRGRLCLSQARSRYGNDSHRFQTSSRP